MKYVKSCLNYTGGKYRLLKQILPLFPENINTFLDIFCGGANVGLNVNANSIICNDINAPLIQLFNYIKDNDYNIIFQEIKDIIHQYSLSESDLYGYDYYGCDSSKGLGKFNKINYTKLRDDFNSGNIYNWNKCSILVFSSSYCVASLYICSFISNFSTKSKIICGADIKFHPPIKKNKLRYILMFVVINS